MIALSVWDVLNIIVRVGIVGIVIYKLLALHVLYNWWERAGLGVLGGCMLMTIPLILEGPRSPFAEWSSALSVAGVLVYLCGRLRRQILLMRARMTPAPNAVLERLVRDLDRKD